MNKKFNSEENNINNKPILVKNNHIYFYKDIDSNSCVELNKTLDELTKFLLKQSIDFDCKPNNIFLHIKSNGGCVLSAFSIIDNILNSKIPVISIVEGAAASAATLISMVCHKRLIKYNAFMLIHQISSGSDGKYEELKDEIINDTKIMNKIYNLYLKYTNINMNSIKTSLKHDIWWDSDECLKYGIVDEIYKNDSLLDIKINVKNKCKRISISNDELIIKKKSKTSY